MTENLMISLIHPCLVDADLLSLVKAELIFHTRLTKLINYSSWYKMGCPKSHLNEKLKNHKFGQVTFRTHGIGEFVNIA